VDTTTIGAHTNKGAHHSQLLGQIKIRFLPIWGKRRASTTSAQDLILTFSESGRLHADELMAIYGLTNGSGRLYIGEVSSRLALDKRGNCLRAFTRLPFLSSAKAKVRAKV
jgi:hypothetical protein